MHTRPKKIYLFKNGAKLTIDDLSELYHKKHGTHIELQTLRSRLFCFKNDMDKVLKKVQNTNKKLKQTNTKTIKYDDLMKHLLKVI